MSYDNKRQFSLIEENDYECFIEDASITQFPSGTEALNLKFRIREDVEEQKFKDI